MWWEILVKVFIFSLSMSTSFTYPYDSSKGMEFLRQFHVIPLSCYNSFCILEESPCMIPTIGNQAYHQFKLSLCHSRNEWKWENSYLATLQEVDGTMEKLPKEIRGVLEEWITIVTRFLSIRLLVIAFKSQIRAKIVLKCSVMVCLGSMIYWSNFKVSAHNLVVNAKP